MNRISNEVENMKASGGRRLQTEVVMNTNTIGLDGPSSEEIKEIRIRLSEMGRAQSTLI